MISKEILKNTFPSEGKFQQGYDTLRKFRTASMTLMLRTNLELVDERDLRYEITLDAINKSGKSLMDLMPLVDDGWCFDEERQTLYLPLS